MPLWIKLYDGEKHIQNVWMDWPWKDPASFYERIHPEDRRLDLIAVTDGMLVYEKHLRIQRFNRIGRTKKYRLEGT